MRSKGKTNVSLIVDSVFVAAQLVEIVARLLNQIELGVDHPQKSSLEHQPMTKRYFSLL